MLLTFLTRVYRTLTEVFCWIWMIAGAIMMGIIFENAFYFDGRVIVGGLVGLITVFSFEVTFLPPIMILFEINNNLEKINGKSDSGIFKRENMSSSGNTKPLRAHDSYETINDNKSHENSQDIWICKKCGEENSTTKNFCSSCGEYK